MQSRLLLRQSSSPDVVTLPDVGRMDRLEFRSLEARLYGHQRLPSRAGTSSSSANSTTSPHNRQTLEPRPVAELRSVGRRVFANNPAHSSSSSQRLRSEVSATRQSTELASSSSDLVSLFSRGSERELHQLLQLQSSGGSDNSQGSPQSVVANGRTPALATGERRRSSIASSTPMGERRSSTQQLNHSLDDIVHVPDVGRMSRRQLQRLETVLNGTANLSEDELADLPDLTGMDVNQLSQIESALSDNFTNSSTTTTGSLAGDSLAQLNSQVSDTISTQQVVPSSLSSRAEPQAIDAFQPSSSTAPSDFLAALRGASSQHWRIEEETFQRLFVAPEDLTAGTECSICYEPVKDGTIALPCSKQSCDSYFHDTCIRPWLEKNPSCPLCRCSVKELVTLIAPQCRGCGGEAASPDLLLTAAGLMGRHRALTWLSRQRAAMSSGFDDSDGDFPAAILAALGGEIDPMVFVPELLAAIIQSSSSEEDTLVATRSQEFARAARRGSFRDARANLEGVDLANRLGETYGGQWQTAATLLGLADSPQVDESLQINSDSQNVPTNANEQANTSNPRRTLRPWRSNSQISAAPPSRWLSSQAPDVQQAPQHGLAMRQSELVLRASAEIDSAVGRGGVGRQVASTMGGGWRPSSRGSSRYQGSIGSRSMSVPQLARTNVSRTRAYE